jgi:hypothetical protein
MIEFLRIGQPQHTHTAGLYLQGLTLFDPDSGAGGANRKPWDGCIIFCDAWESGMARGCPPEKKPPSEMEDLLAVTALSDAATTTPS